MLIGQLYTKINSFYIIYYYIKYDIVRKYKKLIIINESIYIMEIEINSL